jgi:hypothetical protein
MVIPRGAHKVGTSGESAALGHGTNRSAGMTPLPPAYTGASGDLAIKRQALTVVAGDM